MANKEKWQEVFPGESVFEAGKEGEMKPVGKEKKMEKEKEDPMKKTREEAEIYAKSRAMAARNREEYEEKYQEAYDQYLKEHTPMATRLEDFEEIPIEEDIELKPIEGDQDKRAA